MRLREIVEQEHPGWKVTGVDKDGDKVDKIFFDHKKAKSYIKAQKKQGRDFKIVEL